MEIAFVIKFSASMLCYNYERAMSFSNGINKDEFLIEEHMIFFSWTLSGFNVVDATLSHQLLLVYNFLALKLPQKHKQQLD